MPVTLPAAGIIGAQCGNYCRYVGYSAEKRSYIREWLAFCGFLYQAIGTMSSYDNAQKARAG
jgi:hypothetical protein